MSVSISKLAIIVTLSALFLVITKNSQTLAEEVKIRQALQSERNINDDYIQKKLLQVEKLAQQKLYQKAVDELNRIIHDDLISNEQLARTYVKRANIYLKTNEIELAKTDFSYALWLGGLNKKTRANIIAARAMIFYQTKKYPKALSEITRARKLDPNNPDIILIQEQIENNKNPLKTIKLLENIQKNDLKQIKHPPQNLLPIEDIIETRRRKKQLKVNKKNYTQKINLNKNTYYQASQLCNNQRKLINQQNKNNFYNKELHNDSEHIQYVYKENYEQGQLIQDDSFETCQFNDYEKVDIVQNQKLEYQLETQYPQNEQKKNIAYQWDQVTTFLYSQKKKNDRNYKLRKITVTSIGIRKNSRISIGQFDSKYQVQEEIKKFRHNNLRMISDKKFYVVPRKINKDQNIEYRIERGNYQNAQNAQNSTQKCKNFRKKGVKCSVITN